MTSTQETIRAFYSNIENKDFEAVRGLLHDDLEFRGPIDAFDAADDLVAKLSKLEGVTEAFRVRHLFVDGERGCCVYDLITATPLRESPVTEYFELRDGRITVIHAFYDSRPWVALFGKEEG